MDPRSIALCALLSALAMAGGAQAAGLSCPALDGVERATGPNVDFLLLAEFHGSMQAPRLFADLVCAAARDGRPVVAALEMTPDNQPALDAYLASDGGGAAKAALALAPAWKARDGRASQAVFEAVERIRAYRQAGARITLAAFDHAIATPGTSALREEALARNLAAAHRPGALVVALTGRGHGDKTGWTSATPPYKSTVQHLPEDRTLSLAAARQGGELWSCRRSKPEAAPTCQAWPTTNRDPPAARGVRWDTPPAGFDATAAFGEAYAASPPVAVP